MNHGMNPYLAEAWEREAADGRTVFPVVPPDRWPRGTLDRFAELVVMALAEAGHPTEVVWSGPLGVYLLPGDLSHTLLDRARVLVYTHLGIEFEVRSAAVEVES